MAKLTIEIDTKDESGSIVYDGRTYYPTKIYVSTEMKAGKPNDLYFTLHATEIEK